MKWYGFSIINQRCSIISLV